MRQLAREHWVTHYVRDRPFADIKKLAVKKTGAAFPQLRRVSLSQTSAVWTDRVWSAGSAGDRRGLA